MAERLLSISKIKQLRVPAVIIALLIIAGVIYFPNYAKIKKMRWENNRLTQEIKKLQVEIDDYEDKIQRLGNDPYLYERIARDDLGVARENEIIIDIEE